MELSLLPIVFHVFHENHACSVEHRSCENDIHANGSARMMDLKQMQHSEWRYFYRRYYYYD